MNRLSTPLHVEDHIRQIREEGERRILASAVLARCESLSEYSEPLLDYPDPLRYHARHSGFAFMHLARTLAHFQKDRE